MSPTFANPAVGQREDLAHAGQNVSQTLAPSVEPEMDVDMADSMSKTLVTSVFPDVDVDMVEVAEVLESPTDPHYDIEKNPRTLNVLLGNAGKSLQNFASSGASGQLDDPFRPMQTQMPVPIYPGSRLEAHNSADFPGVRGSQAGRKNEKPSQLHDHL